MRQPFKSLATVQSDDFEKTTLNRNNTTFSKAHKSSAP